MPRSIPRRPRQRGERRGGSVNSSLGYDPESSVQDADIEMAELTAAANRDASLRRKGLCRHSWLQGPPGPAHKPTKVWTCHHCGKVFQSEAELFADAAKLDG